MNDSGHFKRACETKAKLTKVTQGRTSEASVIKCMRLFQIHVGYQLKTTVVGMRKVDSINYLTKVEMEQDFLPLANTPDLPRPWKLSSLKIELLASRFPLDGLPVVHSVIIRRYGKQA